MRLSGTRTFFRDLAISFPLVLLASHPAPADLGDCGQPFSSGTNPVTTDVLFVLRASVGTTDCELCVCDTNGNGAINTTDALRDLRHVVGQDVSLDCPPCATTTTTLPDCPPENGLDDVVFEHKYTCIQSFDGGEYFCVDQNVEDPIRFQHKGGGFYEIRSEPATDFVYTGTLSCTTFNWSAESPGEYTEGGTWNFTDDLSSFEGTSTYEGVYESYSGICNGTGVEAPGTAPDTDPLPPCE